MGRKRINPAGEHAYHVRVPADVWVALKALAAAERRSVNAQLVWLLQQQLAQQAKPK